MVPQEASMIALTRLDEREVVVNADAILTVEAAPDTILTLWNGDKVTVRESVRDVIDRVVAYRRRLRPAIVRTLTEV
jgi:flagellar protein FlbD